MKVFTTQALLVVVSLNSIPASRPIEGDEENYELGSKLKFQIGEFKDKAEFDELVSANAEGRMTEEFNEKIKYSESVFKLRTDTRSDLEVVEQDFLAELEIVTGSEDL